MPQLAKVHRPPDDILSAILELAKRAGKEDRFAFRGHDEALQRVFFKLSQNPKYDLLSEFVFSSSGARRYSPALSDAVSKLQLAGLLGRQNPDYEILFTTPPAGRFYDEVLSRKFSAKERDQLKEIAKEFRSIVSGL